MVVVVVRGRRRPSLFWLVGVKFYPQTQTQNVYALSIDYSLTHSHTLSAHALNSQANKYYTPGRSMYVTLEVNPKIASLCVSMSKVRELLSSLHADFEIWYGFDVPWTALPRP